MISSDQLSEEQIEWIKGRIAWSKRTIDSTLDTWGDVVPDQVSSTYFGMGLDAESIALYSLLLGDRQGALHWFRVSAENYEKCYVESRASSGMLESDVAHCYDLLHMSVLTGDGAVMEEAAKVCLSVGELYPKKYRGSAPWYYYDKTVGFLLLGDVDRAAAMVGLVNVGVSKPFKDHFDGLAQCLKGITTTDRETVVQGLNLVLKYHRRKYGSSDIGPADEVLCVPATVHIKLARMKGIMIMPEDIEEKYRKYIPLVLFESA